MPISSYPSTLSPLAGDINWMETRSHNLWTSLLHSPHSLGILIEWKQAICNSLCSEEKSPHSLGILIEWKPFPHTRLLTDKTSPLAGDINWMETLVIGIDITSSSLKSPLAGDINWMETFTNWLYCQHQESPHSLGILIEWKLFSTWITHQLNPNKVPTRWGY